MTIIPALGKLRKEDCEFEASLGCTVSRNQKEKKKKSHCYIAYKP
jgi:hypothetical protein